MALVITEIMLKPEVGLSPRLGNGSRKLEWGSRKLWLTVRCLKGVFAQKTRSNERTGPHRNLVSEAGP